MEYEINENQKFKVKNGNIFADITDLEPFTIKKLIDNLINLGKIKPVQTRKVYRWKHSGIEIDAMSLRYSYNALYYDIDADNFKVCLAAGLIIESEEVVEPEPKPKPEPKFKVGDRVKIIGEGEHIPAVQTTIGKSGIIEYIDGSYYKVNIGYTYWYYTANQLEPVQTRKVYKFAKNTGELRDRWIKRYHDGEESIYYYQYNDGIKVDIEQHMFNCLLAAGLIIESEEVV